MDDELRFNSSLGIINLYHSQIIGLVHKFQFLIRYYKYGENGSNFTPSSSFQFLIRYYKLSTEAYRSIGLTGFNSSLGIINKMLDRDFGDTYEFQFLIRYYKSICRRTSKTTRKCFNSSLGIINLPLFNISLLTCEVSIPH